LLQGSRIATRISEVRNEIRQIMNSSNSNVLIILSEWVERELSDELNDFKERIDHLNVKSTDFYNELSLKAKYKYVFIIYAFNNSEELVTRCQELDNVLQDGGYFYIYNEQEDISKYSAVHFLNRFNLDIKEVNYLTLRLRRRFNHIMVARYFNIEPDYKKDVRFNFLNNLFLYQRFNITNFTPLQNVIRQFFEKNYQIIKRESDSVILKKHWQR
jgi:hypothetical protein